MDEVEEEDEEEEEDGSKEAATRGLIECILPPRRAEVYPRERGILGGRCSLSLFLRSGLYTCEHVCVCAAAWLSLSLASLPSPGLFLGPCFVCFALAGRNLEFSGRSFFVGQNKSPFSTVAVVYIRSCRGCIFV